MKRRNVLWAAGAGLGELTLGCNAGQPSAATATSETQLTPPTPTASPSSASSASEAQGEVPQPGRAPKELLVGAYLPLTGADATFGSEARKGIELAVAAVNAAGGARGAQLRILFEDDRSLMQDVDAAIGRLAERQQVVALIGEIASARALLGAKAAAKLGIPMITPSATHAAVTKGQAFAFRTCFIDEAQGHAAAELALSILKKKKVAILCAEDDLYSAALAAEFEKAVPELGGKLVARRTFKSTERSFAEHLKAIKAARAEIVFAPLYYNQMVFVAREAKRQKLPMTTFVGGDGWAGDAAALAELEGGQYIDHWAVDLPTPASRTFVEAYKKEFGEPPQSIAATSYDAILVLADAINRASSLAGKDVRDAIATTKDLPTVTGPITIDAEHNAQKPLIAVQVRNKTAHFVAAVGPGSQAVNAYKVVSP